MIKVNVDGAARPNPGKGAVGVLIQGDGWDYTLSHGLPNKVTNNQAEYQAVYHALRELESHRLYDHEITIYSDAQMIVDQLNGRKEVEKGAYLEDYFKVRHLLNKFSNVTIIWIPREENDEANSLASKALKGVR